MRALQGMAGHRNFPKSSPPTPDGGSLFSGLGFRVWGLGLRVWGLGFGVQVGTGPEIPGHTPNP